MIKDPVVTIKFKLSELNYTLQALAARPYVEVNELLTNLQEQGQQAINEAKADEERTVEAAPA